jgi:MFS family permease
MIKFSFDLVSQKNYYFHFLVFPILFLCLIFILPIKMEQTDEFGMMILASGIYTGEQENMLIFISPIIGKFLNFLYTVFSEKLNWYSIFILFVYFSSWLAILNLVTCIKEFTKEKILGFYFLFITFGVYFILNFSFTVASFFLGITAILYYLFSPKTIANIVIFVSFFIICFLLRSFVFYYLIILFCAIIVLEFIFDNRKINFKQLSILIAFAALFFWTNNKLASQNHEWQKFLDYNIVRGRLQDNPNFYFNNKEEIKLKMNWSETDYQMLYNWNTDIENKFTKHELAKLLGSLKLSTFWGLYYLHYILKNSLFYYVLTFLLFFSVLNKNYNWKLFLIALFFITSLLIISQFYIMKERVFLPLLFSLFMLLLFNYKFKKVNFASFVTATLFLVFMSYKSYSKAIETQSEITILNKNKKIFDTFSKQDFVLWGDLKLNYFTGFYQPYLSLKGRMYISNWFSNSPHNNKILRAKNAQSIYEYSIQNSNCLWVVEREKYNFKSNLLKKAYSENFEINIECEKIETQQNSTWAVFRIKKN